MSRAENSRQTSAAVSAASHGTWRYARSETARCAATSNAKAPDQLRTDRRAATASGAAGRVLRIGSRAGAPSSRCVATTAAGIRRPVLCGPKIPAAQPRSGAAAQARTPHVTKPSCWPSRRFRDRLMNGAGRVVSRARSRPFLPGGRITEPFALLGIDLRPGRVAAIHDRRPVLVRREQQVLAEYPFLRVFPGGGEAGDLGEVAFTWLVIAGQIIGVLVDPLGDHLADHGEERAGVTDLLVDLGEAAFPLPAGEFAIVVERQALAAIRRLRPGLAVGHAAS